MGLPTFRRRRLVVTTYDHTNPITKSDHFSGNNSYGQVYSKVVGNLEGQGWEVRSEQFPRVVAEPSNALDVIREVMKLCDAIDEMNPNLVIHDPDSFRHQTWELYRTFHVDWSDDQIESAISMSEHYVSDHLLSKFKGRIERVDPKNLVLLREYDTSSKHQFFKKANELGIPVPKTIIIDGLREHALSYGNLAQQLTGSSEGEIIMKASSGSGGKKVHLLRNQRDLEYVRENYGAGILVAQERIPLPTGLPYSIRVVTWGDRVLGSVLLVNDEDEIHSNAGQGGKSIDLAVRRQTPRTDDFGLYEMDRTKVEGIAEVCGIDLRRRKLPQETERLAKVVGGHSANYLLKGTDFMYLDGRPVALETNIHPGPPSTGMYSNILGIPKRKRVKEVDFAAIMITYGITGRF